MLPRLQMFDEGTKGNPKLCSEGGKGAVGA